MPANPQDLELLTLQAATLFVLSDVGRIVSTNERQPVPGPRLYLAGCATGNILLLAEDVSAETTVAIQRLVAQEPPLDKSESEPIHLAEYSRLLGAERPATNVNPANPGLNWAIPRPLAFHHSAKMVLSGSADGNRLSTRIIEHGMPPALIAAGFEDISHFWQPWCAVLDGAEIASIAFSARISPAVAETGLYTLAAYRARGFGAAATAGWAAHPNLKDRQLFYSTSRTNLSSRKVAARLGLRFIGATLSID